MHGGVAGVSGQPLPLCRSTSLMSGYLSADPICSEATTELYDRTDDQITLDEVEKIGI